MRPGRPALEKVIKPISATKCALDSCAGSLLFRVVFVAKSRPVFVVAAGWADSSSTGLVCALELDVSIEFK